MDDYDNLDQNDDYHYLTTHVDVWLHHKQGTLIFHSSVGMFSQYDSDLLSRHNVVVNQQLVAVILSNIREYDGGGYIGSNNDLLHIRPQMTYIIERTMYGHDEPCDDYAGQLDHQVEADKIWKYLYTSLKSISDITYEAGVGHETDIWTSTTFVSHTTKDR